MKRIEVRSKSKAREFSPPDETWAAISVATYEGDWPKLSECKRMGLLQVFFPDVSFRIEPALEYHKLFDEEQAQKILDFVDSVKDKIDVLLVHCEAGVSRSPAIAAAIDRIYLGLESAKPYFANYRPNILVYQTLTNLAAKQGRLTLQVTEAEDVEVIQIEEEVPLEIIE